LYNLAGTLYWNGSAVGSGGSGGFGDWVTVAPSGDVTGATDRANIQAAINTKKSVFLQSGTFYVNSKITVSETGQTILGAGVPDTATSSSGTIVRATSNFSGVSPGWTYAGNKADSVKNGVFVITGACVTFENFKLYAPQDLSPTNRSSFIKFPPALHFVGAVRGRVLGMRISLFNYGIFLNGNCGGIFIDRCEISFTEQGITSYGYTGDDDNYRNSDTVRISDVQFWSFDMGTNSIRTYMYGNDQTDHLPESGDSAVTCIYMEYTDDLRLHGCLSMAALFLYAKQTWGEVTNCASERSAFKLINSSQFEVTASHFHIGLAMQYHQLLEQTGGRFIMSTCFLRYNSSSDPTSSVMKIMSSGVFQLSNCRIYNDQNAESFIEGISASQLILMGNTFHVKAAGSVFNIRATGNYTRLTMHGNIFHNENTGYDDDLAGVAILYMDQDSYHNIIGNTFFNGSVSKPTFTNSQYAYNK